ncbi:hypothetical protein V8E54_008476 [Elaphomyces granulatus]
MPSHRDDSIQRKVRDYLPSIGSRKLLTAFGSSESPERCAKDTTPSAHPPAKRARKDNDNDLIQVNVDSPQGPSKNIPEVPGNRLQLIENCITETLALGQDLNNVQRFAMTFPLMTKVGRLLRAALRTVILSFEQKKNKGKTMLGICTIATSYQAWLDKKIFELKPNEIIEVDEWDQRVLRCSTWENGL